MLPGTSVYPTSSLVPLYILHAPWCLLPQRCSDGSLGQLEDVEELQQRESELAQMKDCMAAMSARISELEEDLDTARKDLIKSEDINTRLQRDLREVGTHT